ncbi:MAG: pyruvate kinase [Gammaproteobacteria bacterium]|nr:pyruvate kinase [Gammaproteobacteria bacterium]MDD9807403.1 pyruvate kinase [Gammaproteobacteria bacterium]
MTEIRQAVSPRKTKIIATLGPSTDDEKILLDLIDAGVDVVRLNFSHGEAEDHIRRARIVRELSAEKRYYIGILGDLQGPKIRLQRFAEGRVTLEAGRRFVLDPSLGRDAGTADAVGITYPQLHADVAPGDTLLLDDGRIVLEVESSGAGGIVTAVKVGGELSNNKGINRAGGGLSAPSITDKDRRDIELAAQIGVDYLAVSFPKSADDIIHAKRLLREVGSSAALIAKIERVEALNSIGGILEVADGVMVARGDLSIEIGDAELTAVQKRLIRQARQAERIVITATEMLQSMIESTVPTRAEISDVANAVLDGSDALMLSAESAIGRHPALAVETMSRVCQGAERGEDRRRAGAGLLEWRVERFDKAIALSTIYAATRMDVAVIAALTESGSTALWMSRLDSPVPIYAVTPHIETCRKVTLYRGVYPVLVARTGQRVQVKEEVVAALQRCRAVNAGDCVIVTRGDTVGKHGGTNTMKIITVP